MYEFPERRNCINKGIICNFKGMRKAYTAVYTNGLSGISLYAGCYCLILLSIKIRRRFMCRHSLSFIRCSYGGIFTVVGMPKNSVPSFISFCFACFDFRLGKRRIENYR